MSWWRDEPTEHEYEAALRYLSLVLPEGLAAETVDRLRQAEVGEVQAKDLMRASGLDALPGDRPEVAEKVEAARSGEALAPVLLVRGDLRYGLHLLVADGFHRICAGMALDPGAPVACKVIDLPDRGSDPAPPRTGQVLSPGGDGHRS